MDMLATTDDLFYTRAGLDRARVEALVADSLHGADDGELFLEYRQAESLSWDDGRLRGASFDTSQGFGLRSVVDDAYGYAQAADLSEDAMRRAAAAIDAVRAGHSGTLDAAPGGGNHALYASDNPLALTPFADKLSVLQDIDAYARKADSRVVQVMASVAGSWQAIQIVHAGGHRAADIRPMVRLNVAVVMRQGERTETGSFGLGGRLGYDHVLTPETWRRAVDKALHEATVNLDSAASPAGEMPVVLGPGWPGVLLHEAIGHGLEGDFNRKGTSAFASLMGERIAAPGVTVVDDGTLNGRRGSINIDDEGTPSRCTTLIEDGRLVGYMQDRMNGRLTGAGTTGNGRRESFAHYPMPRMTNTYMLAGQTPPEEIIASVRDGLYAVNFRGGQVDITSGKFVFSASEAYRIRDGRVAEPVKGATIIGNGPDAMTRISMIGNDLGLDEGIGTCGKQGQWLPVGVGQPTLRIDGLTVGGTG